MAVGNLNDVVVDFAVDGHFESFELDVVAIFWLGVGWLFVRDAGFSFVEDVERHRGELSEILYLGVDAIILAVVMVSEFV